MTEVLCNLDLSSYFRFRQANRSARMVAIALHEFAIVAEHAQETLRDLLRSGKGVWWTIRRLYEALINPYCELCGMFGGFLFLPLALRCCFGCIIYSLKLSMVSGITLDKTTCFTWEHVLANIPDAAFYPQRKRECLGSSRTKPIFHAETVLQYLTSLNFDDKKLRQVIPEEPHRLRYRLKASTVFPYFDTLTNEAENGVYCRGCLITHRRFNEGWVSERDRAYSKSDFVAH